MNITGRPIYQKATNYRFTPLERRYYAWLHDKCRCVLTGYTFVEIAHTGKKSMALKAPISTCLPIRPELHLIEERQRAEFWKAVGFPDHIEWAERLFDIFEARDCPEALLMDMNERANIVAIANMLRG